MGAGHKQQRLDPLLLLNNAIVTALVTIDAVYLAVSFLACRISCRNCCCRLVPRQVLIGWDTKHRAAASIVFFPAHVNLNLRVIIVFQQCGRLRIPMSMGIPLGLHV